MKLKHERIVEWARSRGILDQSTPQFQMLKATEEHGEMASAILNGDRDELIDSIGDQLVVAIVQCAQLGYDVEHLTLHHVLEGCAENNATLLVAASQGEVAGDIARGRNAETSIRRLFVSLYTLCAVKNINPVKALDSVYDIISKRGGEMRNGVWVKSEDL